MKIIMRLYRQHDLDLLYLYCLKNFSLQQEIKKVLIAHVHNTNYTIDYECFANDNDIVLPKQAQFHILLHDEEDKEIIQWVLSISRGYRNSLLKNMVRNYLQSPSLTPYFQSTQITFKQTKEKRENARLKSSFSKAYEEKESIADLVLHTPVPAGNDNLQMKESDDVLGNV